jgi:multiple sugar transport system ATP-binding protein
MAEVEFRSIEKGFPGGARAVCDLTLHVPDGELLVVVGPSGCGKSTVLRMAAGLEAPSAGEVLIDRRVVNSWSPQRRNVAMVFQDYALYPHMSVRGNLEFPLRMRKLPKAEVRAKVAETAGLLALEGLLERMPGALSGGQRQRVAMGRAVVRDPSVFLMDEPLSNLDAKLRVQIRAEIAALHRRLGTTTLYVTHDQVEAMTLGSRVAVLCAGRLQQVAAPADLYARPANLFVASFIGNPGMNILPVQVVALVPHGVRLRIGERPIDVGVPEAARADLRVDAPLWAGVRPEALSLGPEGSLRVRVEAIESLGHEHLVYGRVVGVPVPAVAIDAGAGDLGIELGRVIARLPSRQRPPSGAELSLQVRPESLYLFTPSGECLSYGDPGSIEP